jgi:magnesium-transporting ATPase (P-type)
MALVTDSDNLIRILKILYTALGLIGYFCIGFALIIVVLITGIFSFVQENKETEVRKEIDKLIPDKATVIRY